MKKITLVLVLLACTTFAFAQVEATVDGDATMTWGIDLETNATGFQNAFTASIDFDLVSKASEELTGDAVYGSIKLADFKAVVDEDGGLTIAEPSITAKLLLSDMLYMTIYGVPGFSLNNAKGILHIGAAAATELNAVTGAVAGTTAGLSVTYGFGAMGSATVKVASHGSWDTAGAVDQEFDWVDDDADITTAPIWQETVAVAAATSNTDSLYSAGIDVTLTPMDMLSVGLGAVYGDFTTGDLGLTATLALKPVDMFGVWAKLDGALLGATGSEFAFDTSFGADVTLESLLTLGVAGYYGADDLEVGVDVAVTAVENLSLSAAFDMYTVLTATEMPWATKVALAYDLGGIKPYASVTLDSADLTGINAGVTLTGQVPNTTFKIDYTTTDITNDTGDVEASINIAF